VSAPVPPDDLAALRNSAKIVCRHAWFRLRCGVILSGRSGGIAAAFQAPGERGIARPSMGPGVARAACDPRPADVSVVIPVYNHDRFIGTAIDSVLSQTVQPREILCIDDGSTDRSVQTVEALAARHPNVRFWSRPNHGAARTINEGIREARGQYIAILNSEFEAKGASSPELPHGARLRT
jgi:hypothetical protein